MIVSILPLYSSEINLFFENEMLTLAYKQKKRHCQKALGKECFWQCQIH
ncbi:hypothetical protein BSSC8_30770 [Bacillus subtilis subsp. subtilis str. SC-8]|nr:hypothetical protein BSSC8_30770 [Bacillus subtilis subsp. subtilis str. SC-8]